MVVDYRKQHIAEPQEGLFFYQARLDEFGHSLKALEMRLSQHAQDVAALELLEGERIALREAFNEYVQNDVPDEYVQSHKLTAYRDASLAFKRHLDGALHVAQRNDPAERGWERLVSEPGLWRSTDAHVIQDIIIRAVEHDLPASEARKVVANVRQFQQLIAEYRAILVAEGHFPEKEPVVETAADSTAPVYKTFKVARPVFESEPQTVLVETFLKSDVAKAMMKKASPRVRIEQAPVLEVADEEEEPLMLAEVKALALLKRVKRFFGGVPSPSLPEVATSAMSVKRGMKTLVASELSHERRTAHEEASSRLERSIALAKYLSEADQRKLMERAKGLREQYQRVTEENVALRKAEIERVLEGEAETLRKTDSLEALGDSQECAPNLGLTRVIEQTQMMAESDRRLSFAAAMQQAFRETFSAAMARFTLGESFRQRVTTISSALMTLGRVAGKKMTGFGMLEQAVPLLSSVSEENDNMQKLATVATVQLQSRIDEYLDGYAMLQSNRVGESWVTPTLPEDRRLLDPETLRLAAVRGGDGVTQVLARQIKRAPKMFGYTGDGDEHVFAVKKALEIAKTDGIDDRWLRSTSAVGQVAIVPEFREGAVHAIFRDVATGHEIAKDALHQLGVHISARAV